jgi:hypothetical protein
VRVGEKRVTAPARCDPQILSIGIPVATAK